MANEENLIPLNKRSKKVQREIQEKGRKANKKKIEERKTLKQELLLLLKQEGMQKKISLSLLKQAEEGNTKAFEIIRDTIGEKPKEQVEISKPIDEQIEKVDNYIKSRKKKNE